jgi:hemolysin activation/secretion protein
VDYDTRREGDWYGSSSWAFSTDLEWSHPDFNSDFDYRRYMMNLRRYHRISREVFLILRAIYGGSDGCLPMHKRFYLGGLGTLRGYAHKEFSGTKFWMLNGEYQFGFPRSSFALSMMYDLGQITDGGSFDQSVELYQSIGAAFYLTEENRISIHRRLDRSEGNGPRIYVRLDHVF